MKKFLMVCAAAATLGTAALASTEASAFGGWGHHGGGWHHGGWGGHHGGWGGGWGGGGWGGGWGHGYGPGFRFYNRPIYSSSYDDCEWARVRTPYGMRWRCI